MQDGYPQPKNKDSHRISPYRRRLLRFTRQDVPLLFFAQNASDSRFAQTALPQAFESKNTVFARRE